MTTQVQLLQLAEKHKANSGVRVLLLSMTEARAQANTALSQTKAYVDVMDFVQVSLDNSQLVTSAAKASASLTRLASDFMSLACLLQELGEEISY